MKHVLFIIIICIVLSSGCSSGGTDENLVIMSWNVQNLFDDVDNGTEYREYDPGLGDWNYDCFHRKAAALADVITSAAVGGPELVLLQEVENNNALKHLNEDCLKASGYEYSLFFPTEGSAVGTGILSRFPIIAVNSHAVTYNRAVRGRNISEATIVLPETEQQLVIFINHWKSKLGGAEETEIYRIAAAELLSELMSHALELSSSAVLAAGDFNESHDEFLRTGEAYQTAITMDGLIGSSLVLYNPWIIADCPGSYFYKDEWETIDQFFLTETLFDGAGWDYSGFETAALEFNSTAEGYPLSWYSSAGIGSSDHFPILLKLSLSE